MTHVVSAVSFDPSFGFVSVSPMAGCFQRTLAELGEIFCPSTCFQPFGSTILANASFVLAPPPHDAVNFHIFHQILPLPPPPPFPHFLQTGAANYPVDDSTAPPFAANGNTHKKKEDGGGAGPSQNAAVRRRLQATVDILGVWESEACEQQSFVSGSIPERAAVPSVPLSSAQRARRLRAEYAARALMGVSGGDGDGGGGDNCGAVSGSMSELLREWWPKLISVAAEARDWEFLSRCVSALVGDCKIGDTRSRWAQRPGQIAVTGDVVLCANRCRGGDDRGFWRPSPAL